MPPARLMEFRLVFTGASLLIEDKAKRAVGTKVIANLLFNLYPAPTLADPLKYIDFKPWILFVEAFSFPVVAAIVVVIFPLDKKLAAMPTPGVKLNLPLVKICFTTRGTPVYCNVFLEVSALMLSPEAGE